MIKSFAENIGFRVSLSENLNAEAAVAVYRLIVSYGNDSVGILRYFRLPIKLCSYRSSVCGKPA